MTASGWCGQDVAGFFGALKMNLNCIGFLVTLLQKDPRSFCRRFSTCRCVRRFYRGRFLSFSLTATRIRMRTSRETPRLNLNHTLSLCCIAARGAGPPSNAASRAREPRFAGSDPPPRGLAPPACSVSLSGPTGRVSSLKDCFQVRSLGGSSRRAHSTNRRNHRCCHAQYRHDKSILMMVAVPARASAATVVVAAAVASEADLAAPVAASVATRQRRSGGNVFDIRSRTRASQRRVPRTPTRPARPSRRTRHRCFISWRWHRLRRTAS